MLIPITVVVFRKRPFQRLVREIANRIVGDNPYFSGDIKFQAIAISALQEMTEAFIASEFESKCLVPLRMA